MNAKQQKIVDLLVASIKKYERIGEQITLESGKVISYEIKEQKIDDEGDLVFMLIETGLVGDEGTYAGLLCRHRRHIMVSPKGAIRLLNARSKRKSRGFFNAVHALRGKRGSLVSE